METDTLIERLSAELVAVKRLRPPAVRALLWLAVIALIAAGAVAHYAGLGLFMARMSVPRIAIECVATGLTGVCAVFAAFMLSVPGNSPRWAALPLPTLVLWLLASGAGCLKNGIGMHGASLIGESGHCFLFIVAVSVPLAVGLFAALRRAHPIAPRAVAALGALGVAAIAAFILEFFHAFDVTVIDLTLHLAAVGLIVTLGVALKREALAPA